MNKNAIKIIKGLGAATAACAAAYGGISTYFFKRKCKLGTELIDGPVKEYEWHSSDKFNPDDYPSITAKNGKVKVLALTDSHLEMTGLYSNNRWTKHLPVKKGFRHIRKLIEHSKPDLIVLTGDILTDPFSDIVFQNIADFLSEFDIPWTMTFGNHDAEWRASKGFFCNIMKRSKNCIFQPGPTNLQGLGNSLVNFKDADGNIFYSLILMDSGDGQRCVDKKIWYSNMILDKTARRFNTVEIGINDRQTEWYRWAVEGLKESCGGTVETMLAMHFAPLAYEYAVRLGEFAYNKAPFSVDPGDSYQPPKKYSDFKTMDEAALREGYEDYRQNCNFYRTVKELDSTKYMITGHNHCFGYTAKFDGINFTSVVKTTSIYVQREYDHGMRGGTVFEISEKAENGSHITKDYPLYNRDL